MFKARVRLGGSWTVPTVASIFARIDPHFKGWGVVSSPSFKGLDLGCSWTADKGATFAPRQVATTLTRASLHVPDRSAVGMAELPFDIPVEIVGEVEFAR